MKLLLDQNISFRIIKGLERTFLGSNQVRRLGLENTSDKIIWEYAKREGYTIVTFDSDFYDLSLMYGHPPKLIWITSGNTITKELLAILLKRIELIKSFIDNNDLSCLEIED